MSEVPQDARYLLFGFGPRLHALMALIANSAGIVSTVVGIVSAAVRSPLGLGTTTWLVLAIVFFLWGLSFWFAAYFGAKEGYTKK